MTTTQTQSRASAAPARAGAGFRPDIQGLRAIAVVLVLVFHAGVPGLPGGYVGVDVFFVISGYLITSMILAEVRQTGRLRLGRFYARRARRLLPAAATVMVATAVATVLWLPLTRWREISGDLASTALYVVNWRLAGRSVDYLAEGAAASPVQHFWSLAVEEQFYLLWPVLVLAVALWARRRGRPVRAGALAVAIGAIAVPSLMWSIHLTAQQPEAAYFVTTTRLWELAVGALLAVGAARLALLDQRWLTGAGVAGLALIAYAACVLTGATPFPGTAALIPTVGAALVLAAGLRDGRGIAVLGLPVMQRVGAMSYSLYLWHWPAVVVATTLWAGEDGRLPVPVGVAAVALSAVPAWLAYRLVEQPVHLSASLRASVRRSALVGLACTLVGLCAAAAVWLAVPSAPSGAAPGAAVIGTSAWTGEADPETDLAEVTPALADVTADVADLYADGCHQDKLGTEAVACTYGAPGAATVVALVGDSHAAQWQPALRAIAEQQGWRLDTYTKGSCAFADLDVWLGTIGAPYETCSRWNDAVTDALLADPPTIVVTSNDAVDALAVGGAPQRSATLDDDVASGLARTWRTLQDAGTAVVALGDTPWLAKDVPECVAEHTDAWTTRCAVPRAPAVARSALAQQRAAAELAGVPLVDLDDYICPQDACPAIIGDVLVWRDAHHLTATYARTLAPRLADRLVPLVPR
ncbi:acyltransferase family protein [Cellulomonas edaphi]|uniref:Acyltransferase family protein n=1 Tax=Cellulomonas edaphi TaxID=3053468 RepID=A0ABT7SAB0_9CELL|nr:acyltransferase family protein [Cellulomons edaphi]MDM7832558.1 acyltransferase family protein [Cellulomons edaphi]